MEAKMASKKRKQTCSSSFSSFPHPLMGISTRNKFQIHMHCNRSGRTRPDRAMGRRFQSYDSICKRPRSINRNPRCSDGDDVLLHTPIKDLRARRIFSPNSDSSMDSGNGKFKAEDDGIASKNGGSESLDDGFSCGSQNADEKQVYESERTEKMDLGFASEAQNLNKSSPKSDLHVGFEEACDKEQNRKPIDNSGGELTPTTPVKPDVSEVKEKHSNEIAQSGVQKLYSGSKTNSALKPCFQRKVFKTPGSVSYRRLLPYLMGIAENNSSALKIDQHPKLDNGLRDKAIQANVVSRCGEVSVERFNKDMYLMECQTSQSDTLSKIVSYSSNESSSGDVLNLGCSLENGIELPPAAVVGNKPPVNGQIGNMDVGVSCNDKELSELESNVSVIVSDLQNVKDSVIGIDADYMKPEKNGTNVADKGYSCMVENESVTNIKSSSITLDSPSGNDKELGQYLEGSVPSHNEVKEIFDEECCNEVQNPSQLEQERGDESVLLRQINHLNEESIQMTPPDAEIFDRQEMEENRVERGEYVLHNNDNGLGRLPSGTNDRNAALDDNRKYKMVLNPRSRLKVFKTPGSISYRRLLPFLTNMASNNSGDSTNVGYLKPEKDLEEKLGSDSKLFPMNKSNIYGYHMEYQTCDPDPHLASTLTTTSNSSENKEPKPMSPEYITGVQMPVESVKELQLQSETSPGILSLLPGPDVPVISLNPMNCEVSPGEECATSVSNNLYLETEADSSRFGMESSSDGVKGVKVEGFCPNSSPSEIPISSEFPDVGLIKGILKRNPRGCRGLCACLNCASFRLHAERSFEFSRNQLEDAEEVASDLMKELSRLCAILEKSAEGANDGIAVQVDMAKEACNKASEAEERAKIRLNQMNYDLNVHCKIPCLDRPRVRFANYVKERVIPKSTF